MSEDTAKAGALPARTTKHARALEIARSRYELHKTAKGGAYAQRGELRYLLEGRAREALRADIRAAWQSGNADDAPSDGVLNAVIADLKHEALQRDADAATPAEQAGQLLEEDSRPPLDEHPDRLKVHASARNPFDVAREVADYLLKENQPPHLFAMGPSAAVLLLDDGTLDALDQDGWLAYVAERVDFLCRTQDGDRIVAPPTAAMKILVPTILRELPQLDGVTSTPYLDADGHLIASDGYHADTRLVLRMGGLALPPVSDAPSPGEVAAAVELLTKEWLGDFPFATDADRANLVAELLTLTGRELFPLSPLFVHDASTSGSGKGLLLNTISIIATGQPPEVMELPGDGDEQRKTVTSVLLSGKLLVAWDELHVIAGRTVAAILTAEIYSGRILGVNKLATVRNKLVQIALGNNVEVRGDMKRRVVPSRLEPKEEHPELRADFRHNDLPGWVRDHRGELLGAAFTIWRNWIARGRIPADITMGSFERWTRTVGGALREAGITGFHSGTSDWLSYSEDDDGWPDHLGQLRRQFDGRWFTVSEVADAVAAGLIKRPPVNRDPDRELSLQLAYAYRSQRDRWRGDLRLVRSRERDAPTGGHTWSVRRRGDGERANTQSQTAPQAADSSPACSVSSESAGQGPPTSAEHGDAPTEHRQYAPAHPQDGDASETAGQGRITEDADHTDDQSDPSGAANTAPVTPETVSGWPPGSYGAEANEPGRLR